MNNSFKGAGVALVTPFKEDKSIDFDALRKLVQLQINGKTDFLVVQGTTGESPTLSWDEKIQVLNTVIDENAGKLKIVFGVGGNNTVEVGKLFDKLPQGVDGILSVSPYYNKPTQQGIIEHYKYIANCTKLPIILYNVPGRTGSSLLASTIIELAKVPNIVAVKEASGNMGHIMDVIRQCPEGFEVISGDDAITLPLIATGAVGVISVLNNAFPEKFNQMVHESLSGDFESARKKHLDLLPITDMLFAEGNPGGVKVALETRGIMAGYLRLPLMPVSTELNDKIKAETLRLINA
ncbi:MAG: 4-hydroxy-tetrahydrodipicolinate synthase [Crocinitomicaceae bacterium]|nr:4-hydroxy-tetrahydrodipicolinate synthase [Crocinitomicaceae bacterium]